MTPLRKQKLQSVANKRLFDFTVVLENIHDPHNAAAIIRTCDAIGIAEIHVVQTIMPWHKKGHKSSASAKDWVKVHFYPEIESCINILKTSGFTLLGTHLSKNSKNLFEFDLTRKIALVFGNEHTGISEKMLSYCDENILIPMNGMVQSLNVSVSAAICLYESFRQRNKKGYDNSQNSENISLYEEWILKELTRSKKIKKEK